MAINFVRYLSAPAGTLETEAAPGQNGSAAPTVSAPPGATAGAAEGDWPSYNKTLTSDRFPQLNQINRDNVGKLKVRNQRRR
jgi:alcohol dehydrogenase (cytochrome c)